MPFRGELFLVQSFIVDLNFLVWVWLLRVKSEERSSYTTVAIIYKVCVCLTLFCKTSISCQQEWKPGRTQILMSHISEVYFPNRFQSLISWLLVKKWYIQFIPFPKDFWFWNTGNYIFLKCMAALTTLVLMYEWTRLASMTQA